MNKCHQNINWVNDTTPAINDTNLNYMDGCIDTIDDRVVELANDPPENALKAEGWAIGEQSGIPVTSGSPYYENNSKYYSQESANEVLRSEGYANGTQNGTPVTSGSPYYENNAKYWKEQAQAIAAQSLSGLSDVSITNPQDGEVLAYDAGNSEWKNSSDLKDSINYLYNMTGGKNQNSYPYFQTTKTENGITFTDLGDGTIKVGADSAQTATADARLFMHSRNDTTTILKDGSYIVNGCPQGGSELTYYLQLTYRDSDDTNVTCIDTGTGASITIENSLQGKDNTPYHFIVFIKSGTTIPAGGLLFKPMIRDACIADDTFAPYAMTNRELTEKVQGIISAAINAADFAAFKSAVSNL